MKILLTTHQFLPKYSTGTEVLTFEVARELIRFGHDVRVLTGWPAEDPPVPYTPYDEYRYEGLQVLRVHSAPLGTTTITERTYAEFDNQTVAAAFSALAASWRPDIVHCFHLQRLSASVALRAAQMGIACVYTATDFWAICPLHQLQLLDGQTCAGPQADSANCVLHLALQGRRAHFAPLYRWVPKGLVGAVLRIVPDQPQSGASNLGAARALQQRPHVMRHMLNVVDRIIAPTAYMATRLKEFGAPEASVHHLSYGIDTEIYANPRPLLGNGHVRVGFIGTLHGPKGAHVLIDAIKLVDPSLPALVSIYGNEETYPDYAAQLRTTAGNDPRIQFKGTFKRADLPQVINELDVLVVPSTWAENTPLVILAAQTAGRPVIGSNVEGIAEVIRDGENGRLFETGNAEALAAVLLDVLRDPNLLLAMSRRSTPPKDISRYGAELLETYQEVLAERADAARELALREVTA